MINMKLYLCNYDLTFFFFKRDAEKKERKIVIAQK